MRARRTARTILAAVQNLRDVAVWLGGALLIVVGVLVWLYVTAPEENLLPEQYEQYKIL